MDASRQAVHAAPTRLDCSSKILTGIGSLTAAPAAPRDVTTLPHLFQYQAKQQPTSIALSCQTAAGRLKTITYADADAIASSIALELSRSHPRLSKSDPHAPVIAVWLEKGLDLVLAILATTYSGATWLPFDPDVPVERAATCIVDADAHLLICDTAHEDQAREVQRSVADLAFCSRSSLLVRQFDELSAAAALAKAGSQVISGPGPRDAAYMIYTSGTTGKPKGIAIPHSAALTFALSEREVLETSSQDVVWNGFSPAFDMFVEELWVTVAGGGHLAIGTRAECRDVPGLGAVWADRGVTIVNAVPTLIGIMGVVQGDESSSLLPPSIRLINLGGEACPPSLVERLARPGLRIINTYGPTETTVTATWDELQPNTPVTIGRPLPSYHACLLPILDDNNSSSATVHDVLELGEGVEGELAIGGPCVGLGYIGRADLTAQKFIPHPLFDGERMYRTGDRVRLQADLKIIFLGRIDTQVKHRGFRIELGEIESTLSSHPDIQAAAVILANPGKDSARLEAFLVPRPGADRSVDSILSLAAQRLPAYMSPEQVYFIDADEMPRLPSGKINAKALHEVSIRKAEEQRVLKPARSEDDLSEADTEAEHDPILGLLSATMAPLFPQSRIRPHSDFFNDLGGHSMLAAVLVSKLRKAKLHADKAEMPFGSIGLPDIYEGRTPSGIASRFQSAANSETGTLFDGQDREAIDGTGAITGEHLPVSRTKFVLCGIAQIIPLIFLFFVYSIEFLVPYLLFDYLIQSANVGWAILAAYGVFVVIPPCLFVTAVIGKWVFLGKAKEGEYPLYGVYYFRWWAAERMSSLANPKLIADSVLYPYFLRAMGAKVGQHCHLGSTAMGAAYDLVEIGDDVTIGADVVFAVSLVERGRLILRKVRIHSDAIISSNCVIEGGAVVGEAAEVAPLSMVPCGMHIPDFERYHGSVARFERNVKSEHAGFSRRTRPSTPRYWAMFFGNSFMISFVLPLLYFVPQIPGLLLFDLLNLRSVGAWGQVAVLSMPIACAYQFLIFSQLLLFRKLLIGRVREGTFRIYGWWYLRFWFVGRLMDLSLDVLHPVFATLYIVPFLRALGVKIGRGAEVSTARGLSFELLEIGEESFVADAVLMGDSEIRGNELTLKKTTLQKRAFAGNASLLPAGTNLASGTLVGVLSIAPPADKPLPENISCFGSPPVLMPARHRAAGHADNVLFNPSVGRVAARLTIEGLRIIMPRALIVFGLGFALQVAYIGYEHIGAVYTLLMLPAFFFFVWALPSLFVTAALKWILIGRYKPAEWPLWSLNVWLSEAVTSTWETITMPLLASALVGTPYLAWCFRLLGVQIGSKVTLLHPDITEYDCVSIGDEATINAMCGAQTHLFEDRIMKIGRVSFGERSCIKPYSICLPGSSVSDGAQLGSLSLVMKSENLPENTAWEGAPVRPRAQRKTTTSATSTAVGSPVFTSKKDEPLSSLGSRTPSHATLGSNSPLEKDLEKQ